MIRTPGRRAELPADGTSRVRVIAAACAGVHSLPSRASSAQARGPVTVYSDQRLRAFISRGTVVPTPAPGPA
ncbi:MAG TPA: hypothetical protein DHU96_10330 [Actinobacteria bacterium]|nr:hypothetical protein [Actinomycetota bacterium]